MKTIGHSLEALERYFQSKGQPTAQPKPRMETIRPGVREKRITTSNGTYKVRRIVK